MPSVRIAGVAQPAGNLRRNRHGGGMYQANKKLKPWQDLVGGVVARAREHLPPTAEPVALFLRFRFTRPKSHYTGTGRLSSSARRTPSVRPDLDKLVRGVLDALKGTLYADDGQVVALYACKEYAPTDELELKWDVLTMPADEPVPSYGDALRESILN